MICFKKIKWRNLLSTGNQWTEIDLNKSLAKSKNLNFNLEIKESSRKMFLSGEWDATSTLLENENLIENKFNDLPYLKFNSHLI